MTTFKAAAIQIAGALYEPAANRAATVAAIEAELVGGARLFVLPELIISGYGVDAEELRRSAEPLDGPTLAAWSALAAKHGIWIAGGFCEIDDGRLYNAAMLVGASGLVGHYRKLHLFDREKMVFTPGDKGLNVFETDIGAIGLCVCYDLRFVEVVRALALQGADIVAVPTAWVGGFDRNPRDAMGFIGQARGALVQANLNQVYMVCASQSGHVEDIRFLGSSMIVDPFGEVMSGPMDDLQQGAVSADLDIGLVRASRVRSELIRPREDRRTDVYGTMINGTIL